MLKALEKKYSHKYLNLVLKKTDGKGDMLAMLKKCQNCGLLAHKHGKN